VADRSGGNGELPSFARARSAAGLIMVGLVVILAIIDAMSETFTLDTIQFGLLLGTGLLFLGVDAGKRLIGGGR
jgi:hypothetical protein